MPLPSSFLSCPQVLSLRVGRRQWILTVMLLETEKTSLESIYTAPAVYSSGLVHSPHPLHLNITKTLHWELLVLSLF